jgi:hypothetical protein
LSCPELLSVALSLDPGLDPGCDSRPRQICAPEGFRNWGDGDKQAEGVAAPRQDSLIASRDHSACGGADVATAASRTKTHHARRLLVGGPPVNARQVGALSDVVEMATTARRGRPTAGALILAWGEQQLTNARLGGSGHRRRSRPGSGCSARRRTDRVSTAR